MRAVRAPSVTYQRPRGVTAWADDGPPSVEGGPVLRQRAANWTNGERVALLFFGVRADSTHGRPSFRWMTRYVVLSDRSEEHTSELQSLMRISYAVFCLKKKKKKARITSRQRSLSD